MKAKLYINSEKSTIKVEGGPSDVLHLLVWAGRLDCSTTRSAR